MTTFKIKYLQPTNYIELEELNHHHQSFWLITNEQVRYYVWH